jgi:hypothetical protein
MSDSASPCHWLSEVSLGQHAGILGSCTSTLLADFGHSCGTWEGPLHFCEVEVLLFTVVGGTGSNGSSQIK